MDRGTGDSDFSSLPPRSFPDTFQHSQERKMPEVVS